MTNVEIKVISDRDRICSLEKVMRGGVSYISKRFSKANNMYLKCYDSKQESRDII